MARPKQIHPRRLEIVIEKLDLAKESFDPKSEEWRTLNNCQAQVRALLKQWTASQ